ncbi:MAG TPA: TatD family hydrolase [Clostridia bacterium]
MFFDTHAHFNDRRFADDREAAIKNAYDSGVSYILNVSYDEKSMQHSVSLSGKYSFIYAAVGIHPHYAEKMDNNLLEKVKSLSTKSKVVAIGEIGLDYFRDLSPRDIQKKWFKRQIELSSEVKLPIIIHVRDAYEDMVEIIKATDARNSGGIIHSFMGDIRTAREVLDNNFYISFSGPITYKNARDLIDVVKFVPEDRILIETDCPYLTPEPHRGKRNDSSLVVHVTEKIAEIKGKSVEEIANITTGNAKRLFNIQ